MSNPNQTQKPTAKHWEPLFGDVTDEQCEELNEVYFGARKRESEPIADAGNVQRKLYIFRPRGTMDFVEIISTCPMFAVRDLIAKHGKRPYQLINITKAEFAQKGSK